MMNCYFCVVGRDEKYIYRTLFFRTETKYLMHCLMRKQRVSNDAELHSDFDQSLKIVQLFRYTLCSTSAGVKKLLVMLLF